MGEMTVPANATTAADGARGRQLPDLRTALPPEPIRALGLVKAACARVNVELGLLEPRLADAIGKPRTRW